MIALDRNCVNGQEAVTRIEVSHFLDSIRYNRLGAIVACREMRVSAWSVEGQEERPVGAEKVVTAESEREFRLKMMKVLAKCWTQSGKRLGIRSRFYWFSPVATDVLWHSGSDVCHCGVQRALRLFQHCIQGCKRGRRIAPVLACAKTLTSASGILPTLNWKIYARRWR